MSPTFIAIAVIMLFAAAAAMSLRNLVHCALSLVVALAGLAALYLNLGAQFVGFAQILVYVGAVAILIVFAILLTRSGETPNQAVVAPGTGLGEAGLFWDGSRHHVFACEGGHTDYAPQGDEQIELLRFLNKRIGHVSYERILSGPGLVNVYEFLCASGCGKETEELTSAMNSGDPAAAISRAALDGKDMLASKALDLWISVYGAEASNLALKIMSTGGMFLAGGISPKILPKLRGPVFIEAFLNKGRMRALVESMPVHVVTNEKVGLLGAARCAAVRGFRG